MKSTIFTALPEEEEGRPVFTGGTIEELLEENRFKPPVQSEDLGGTTFSSQDLFGHVQKVVSHKYEWEKVKKLQELYELKKGKELQELKKLQEWYDLKKLEIVQKWQKWYEVQEIQELKKLQALKND